MKEKEEGEKLEEGKKAAMSTKTGKRKQQEDIHDESEEECDSPSNLALDLNSESDVEMTQKAKKKQKV